MATEQSTTTPAQSARKVTNPKDGRLKANRDFRRFLLRAVYEPQVRGVFRNDPLVRVNAAADRAMRAEALTSLSDEQVLHALTHVLAAEGYQPQGKADTIIKELSQRANH